MTEKILAALNDLHRELKRELDFMGAYTHLWERLERPPLILERRLYKLVQAVEEHYPFEYRGRVRNALPVVVRFAWQTMLRSNDDTSFGTKEGRKLNEFAGTEDATRVYFLAVWKFKRWIEREIAAIEAGEPRSKNTTRQHGHDNTEVTY